MRKAKAQVMPYVEIEQTTGKNLLPPKNESIE